MSVLRRKCRRVQGTDRIKSRSMLFDNHKNNLKLFDKNQKCVLLFYFQLKCVLSRYACVLLTHRKQF